MKIDTKLPVMLTGATGYVAGPIVKALLDEGLTVHCPVRDPTNEAKVKHLVDAAAASSGSIKFFKADLLDEGSYLESMKGCSVVFHTASPFVLSVDRKDVQEKLFDPAVKGTQNVLDSVSKTPTVKRVVLTSSCYAVLTDAADCQLNDVVDENVWNTTASADYNPYACSKVLAEKEAWKIADAQDQYKLVTILPSWVMGPGIKIQPSSESYSFMKMIGDGAMKTGCPDMGVYLVDVRDVATAHVRAAFTPEASGRYCITGHNTSILRMAKSISADDRFANYPLPKSAGPKTLFLLIAPYIGLSRTQIWRGIGHESTLSNAKSKKELGMEYQPMNQTLTDMFAQMVDGDMIAKPSQ